MHRLARTSGLIAAAALLWTFGRPARELPVLLHPGRAGDPFDPLLAGLTLLAWAVLIWLVAVLAASLAARLPGAAGRGAAALGRVLTPVTLRGAAEILLGASVAVGVAAPTPALAGSGPALPAIPAAAERGLIPQMPAWVSVGPPPAPELAPVLPAPVVAAPAVVAPAVVAPAVVAPAMAGRAAAMAGRAAATQAAPALDWPAAAAPSVAIGQVAAGRPVAASAAAAPQPTAAGGAFAPQPVAANGAAAPAGHSGLSAPAVVVQAGDSLWRIAAGALAADAKAAQVARSWPRWWAANRALIGPDPDLIQPGMSLEPPG